MRSSSVLARWLLFGVQKIPRLLVNPQDEVFLGTPNEIEGAVLNDDSPFPVFDLDLRSMPVGPVGDGVDDFLRKRMKEDGSHM